jgi:hypothetical protein
MRLDTSTDHGSDNERLKCMIARTWQGWAPSATADDYQRHYETEVTEHL